MGDLYVVKIGRFAKGSDPKYPYGVLRVASLAGANLELQLGKFGYNRPSGAENAIRTGQIASGGFFAAEPLSVPVQELPPLKSQGVICSVRRR